MDNPFAGLKMKRAIEDQGALSAEQEWKSEEEQKKQKRDSIYRVYSPLVEEVLDQLIAAYKPGLWKKGSDDSHVYCCHINWFAGPEESHHASYDEHHEIRRRIEITLEIDSLCNPIAFKIINHANLNKCVHVELSRDALIGGVKAVFE